MFRSLFGSNNDRPGPPKNQIEVVCPACSAAQYEPRLVVSTFCKKCGVHLSIHRKKVTASSVTRSGMGMPDPWADAAKKPAPPPAKPTVPSPARAHPSAIRPISAPAPTAAEPPPPAVSPNEAAEGGFGSFLMQQTAPAASPISPAPEEEPTDEIPLREESEAPAQEESASESESAPDTESSESTEDTAPEPTSATPTAKGSSVIQKIAAAAAQKPVSEEVQAPAPERRAHSQAPAPTAAPVPMTASTLQKMKNEGLYRNQYFKDAECFECDHKFKVSRSTRSTQCPNCEAMICLEDVEVNMPSSESIKTRGDVLIRKRGQVSAESIICKDLRCQGTLEANVKATGDAIFRATGTMLGQVHCRRFIVEKGADVTFEHEVYADEVEVYARVTGSIFCNGCLLIGANGCVNGDVTTRSVSIEPGGELNGAMNIVRTPRTPPPAPPKE